MWALILYLKYCSWQCLVYTCKVGKHIALKKILTNFYFYSLNTLRKWVFFRVIDGFDTLDELEKLPVSVKNYRPLTDTRVTGVTIHANPIAG